MIEPFKGLLLGTFFLVVGLKLDLDTLFREPAFTLGVAVALVEVVDVVTVHDGLVAAAVAVGVVVVAVLGVGSVLRALGFPGIS